MVENVTLCLPRPSAAKSKEIQRDPIVVRTTLDVSNIPENHIVIQVDKFGFSANNITYQALGEHPHFR